jgi:soluble lytic murein transglycosylase-like protein
MKVEQMRSSGDPEPFRTAPRRDDLRSLLASRWVQSVLGATVVVTFGGAVAGAAAERSAAQEQVEGAAEALVAPLVPMAEFRTESVEEAWRRRAVERESNRLAAQYVARGYTVSPELATEISVAALRHDIDPEIAFGLVRAESSFRNTATSPVGAVGLTQLMPRTAAWMEPGVSRAELRNPSTNLDIGFRYLRYLLDKYDGNEDLALLAYNRGPGTVDRALRRGMNPDNGYAAFVRGEANHGHRLFTQRGRGR